MPKRRLVNVLSIMREIKEPSENKTTLKRLRDVVFTLWMSKKCLLYVVNV